MSLLNGKSSVKSMRVGLIAGEGDFPFLVAEAARAKGFSLVVTAIERQASDLLQELAEVYENFKIGEGQRVIDTLKKSGIKQTLMAGSISKKKVYQSGFKADNLSKNVLSGMKTTGDDKILKAVCSVLRLNGIGVMNPASLLKDKVTPKGLLSSRKPNEEEMKDIRLGVKIAKAVGKLDIGQTVVVKRGTVLAVEAIEGTDEMLRRIRNLGLSGGVMVKVSKPQQDLRFDMPVIGPKTIESASLSALSVIALESSKSLILHRDEVIRKANEARLSLWGIP